MKQPSGTLEQRASRVLSPVLGHYTWLEVDHGEGSWLVTRAGRRVLDLTSGIAVTPVGHAGTRGQPSLALVEQLLAPELPAGQVAAILLAPILGEGGYVAAPASFLQGLRELATRIGALLVFDEVQSGFGRAGAWFAAQRFGVTPDVMTLAKALGGGLPLGAVVAPHAMHERWKTSTHGSTFGGNPVSCASGLATIEVLRDEGLVERAELVGKIIVEELAPLRRDPRVREIRTTGAMAAIEFADKAASKSAIAGALQCDVLLITCGAHDQVVRFSTALNIVEADLRGGIRAFV